MRQTTRDDRVGVRQANADLARQRQRMAQRATEHDERIGLVLLVASVALAAVVVWALVNR